MDLATLTLSVQLWKHVATVIFFLVRLETVGFFRIAGLQCLQNLGTVRFFSL